MKPILVVPIAAAVALTACGGDSKPGYCADRGKLEQSIKDLGNVQVIASGGVQKLSSQLQAIEDNARAVTSSAKDDFPKETSAIDTSIAKLRADAQKVSSSPSPQQVAALAADAKSVATSVQDFVKASDSKC
jgi:hypothetical protein